MLFEGCQGAVTARDVAVEPIPQFVELSGCRRQSRPYLHRMVAGVGCSAATFEAVVRSEIAVGPKVEGVAEPAVAERGIGGIDHFIGLRICEVAVDDARRGNVDEIVAGRKSHGQRYNGIYFQ